MSSDDPVLDAFPVMGGHLEEGIRGPRALLSHITEVGRRSVSQLKPRIALSLILVALFYPEPADEERQG